jgi:hypothetical protein
MREIGKRMLFVFLLLGSTFQTLLGQTEFEQIFVIQKFSGAGEDLTSSVLESKSFIRFYKFPNEDLLNLSIEFETDTSALYGYLIDFDYEEYPAEGDYVSYEKMTFKWQVHDDFDNTDYVWPGELLVYHKSNADIYTLKLINTDGNLIKVEGYIDGTQNFEEGE